MEHLLSSRHPAEAAYDVRTLTAILGAARTISFALTVVLLLVARIAMLISGIGIMNIMLVTVRERTREIGVRKAIGAQRNEIMAQFLIEAFLISGGGAVIGILIGVGDSRSSAAIVAGKSARADFPECDCGVPGVQPDGIVFRMAAGESGGEAAIRWNRCGTNRKV